MMVKVKSFLGCLKLETGGLIIAWSSLIICIFYLIISLVGITFLSKETCTCQDLRYIADFIEPLEDFEDIIAYCVRGKTAAFVAFSIWIALATVFGFICCYCIRGIRKRLHSHITPMLILEGVFTLYSFLFLFDSGFNLWDILIFLIDIIIGVYSVIVLYSLYMKFKEEKEANRPAVVYSKSESQEV